MMEISGELLSDLYNARVKEYQKRFGDKVETLPWEGVGISGKMSGTNIIHTIRGNLFREVYPFNECREVIVLNTPSYYPKNPEYDHRKWITSGNSYGSLNILPGGLEKKLNENIKNTVEECLKHIDPFKLAGNLRDHKIISDRMYEKREEKGTFDDIIEKLPPEFICPNIWKELSEKVSGMRLDSIINVFVGDPSKIESFLTNIGYTIYNRGESNSSEPQAVVIDPKSFFEVYCIESIELVQVSPGGYGKIKLNPNNLDEYKNRSMLFLPSSIETVILLLGIVGEKYQLNIGIPAHPISGENYRKNFLNGIKRLTGVFDRIYIEPVTSMYTRSSVQKLIV